LEGFLCGNRVKHVQKIDKLDTNRSSGGQHPNIVTRSVYIGQSITNKDFLHFNELMLLQESGDTHGKMLFVLEVFKKQGVPLTVQMICE
jgi:hypothetical protein